MSHLLNLFKMGTSYSFFIGVGRFRILGGGQGLEYLGGAKGGQISSRNMTS